MNTTIKFSELTRIQKYQYFTRKKFQEVENSYYPWIDELIKKLEDIGEIDYNNIPDLSIYHFSFIKDWQNGEVDTAYVYQLLSKFNIKDTAEKQLTRRLTNFLVNKEKTCPESYNYIEAVRDQILVKTVPLYEAYLAMLIKYFEKMLEVDQQQVKITWIEQRFKETGDVTRQITEVTLNQMFRAIDATIIPHNEYKYVVGNNIVIFDEDLGNGDVAYHWIFAPKTYIKQLAEQFKVSDSMTLMDEKDYISKIIKGYVQ